MSINLPDTSSHTSIIGRNGTGKTQGAAWVLSTMDFGPRDKPWLIVDYKGDDLLSSIGAEEIKVGGKIGKSGVYIVHPVRSEETQEAMEEWFWQIHRRENIGVLFDEGYMIGKNGRSEAFDTLLTQGRSKKISCIVLTQRPVRVSQFVFSEANFFMAFDLHQPDDRKRVDEYIPGYKGISLPEYHSLWFDVKKKKKAILKPVPEADQILDVFDWKLSPRRKII